MASSLHISINAEPIFYVGQIAITNSMFTSVVVTAIIISLAFVINRSIDSNSRRPKGLQNILEAYVEAFWNMVQQSTNNAKATAVIFPLVATFFIYILFNNWYGLMPWVSTFGINEEPKTVQLQTPQVQATTTKAEDVASEPIHQTTTTESTKETHESTTNEAEAGHGKKFIPIFRPATADLNATFALALLSVAATQFIGFKFLGASYLSKFFNLKGIGTFVGLLELVSEFSKIISFAFRLFGNIFAGEVLMAVIYFIVPLLVPMPFIGLEIFVGLIQALVFAMLTVVFMSLATHSHQEH